jgi:hypothetical protein
LQEIKSTDSGVDYEYKTKSMSYIQQRRKANKLENLSRQYEEKSGVRLNTASKEISIWEGEEADNNNKGVDFDKLLSAANSSAHPRDDSSVNDDLYSVDLIDERRQSNQMRHNAHKAASVSKIADSIKQAHERGARTISMLNSCKKYQAFGALDEAIQSNGASLKKSKISEVQAADIRAARERKINRASTVGSSFLLSARDRKNSMMLAASMKAAAAAASAAVASSASVGSIASTPKAAAARKRHNSTDTEGTDDYSTKADRLSLKGLSNYGDSLKSAGRDTVGSPMEQESLYESTKSSPHFPQSGQGFQSNDEN